MVTDEVKKAFQKSFDLADYIAEGDTMYDHLDKQVDIEDYSTANLVDICRKLYDQIDNPQKLKNMQHGFSLLFNGLTKDLETSLKYSNNDSVKHMSNTEKESFLTLLQNSSDVHFDSIEEYLKYVKENTFSDKYYCGNRKDGYIDASLDKLNKLFVEKSLEVCSDKTYNFTRYSCLKYTLLPAIKHNLVNKYGNNAALNEEDWILMSSFEQALRSPESLRQYDDLLVEHQKEIENFSKKKSLELSCKTKRNRVVFDELNSSLPSEDKKKIATMDLEQILYNTSSNYPTQSVGTFKWHYNEFKEPIVLCDGFAKYKNGNEGQRVIAASYGRFGYDTLFREPYGRNPTVSSEGLELVGVSRIGADGIKNYFVLMPLDSVTLKKVKDLNAHDVILNLYANGQKKPILDRHGLDEYTFVQCDRIPKELEDFYLSTVFSDYHLSNSIDKNFRFAGNVSLRDGHPQLSSGYLSNAQDIDACRYASTYSGVVNNRTFYSFEDYCQSSELMSKHLKFVKDIASGVKQVTNPDRHEER